MPAPDFQRSLRAAEAHLTRVDRQLGRVIARVGPCQLETPQKFDPFHALVRSICHQQLHGKAAETIFGRVVAAYGTAKGQADVKRLNAARLPGLRACGLSESKALAIKDLAKKRLDGTVPDWRTLAKLPNEAIIERITEVRGIGRGRWR